MKILDESDARCKPQTVIVVSLDEAMKIAHELLALALRVRKGRCAVPSGVFEETTCSFVADDGKSSFRFVGPNSSTNRRR